MCVHYDIARMATNNDKHANDVGDAGVLVSDAFESELILSKGPPGCLDVSHVTSQIVATTHAMQTGLGLVCGPGLRRASHMCVDLSNPRRESDNVHGNVAIWL